MKETKGRILCAEDDEDTCEMVTYTLGRAGYDVVSAYTFTDALSKVLGGGYDCLLLDKGLPDGTGEDLCRQIRQSNTRIPIIFYSGHAFPRHIEEAMQAGADAYLIKPVDSQELERTVDQLLQSTLAS
jgi:DNA-binding response OmpR family regulator